MREISLPGYNNRQKAYEDPVIWPCCWNRWLLESMVAEIDGCQNRGQLAQPRFRPLVLAVHQAGQGLGNTNWFIRTFTLNGDFSLHLKGVRAFKLSTNQLLARPKS